MCGFIPRRNQEGYCGEHIPSLRKLEQFDQIMRESGIWAKIKEQKKSQSKVTKRCGCKEKQECNHEWELCDDGAGTIVKSGSKMHWGHKASVLGYPRQGAPLDARATKDAATFDGKTLYPHVKELFEMYPEIQPSVERVLVSSQNFMVKLNFNLAKLSIHKDLRFDKRAFTMLF